MRPAVEVVAEVVVASSSLHLGRHGRAIVQRVCVCVQHVLLTPYAHDLQS